MRQEILIQIAVENEAFHFNGKAIKASAKNCIYTIVKIDGKVVRIFNQVKVYNSSEEFWISYNTIEPTSEVFKKLSNLLKSE